MADAAHRGPVVLEGLALPDRYEVRRRIATGGMAAVWCARDRALGRSVAIKLLSMPYAREPVAVRRFKREARAQARLSSHRHVVTIYDVGHATEVDEPIGRPFIVMEYLSGGTVADALRVGEVTHTQTVRWLREAADALDFAHSRGVIHRDIKPANFLLDGDRVLHVADFGIAQLGTEDTYSSTGQVLGTAAYIAPEQVVGRPATEASDRYSLAVTAYELLVGERPFRADNFAAQARQHLEDEPTPPSRRNPKLPPAIDEVLARGLAKRPEARWATASEFAEAVDVALRESPATETRRHRALWAGVLPFGEPATAAASAPPAAAASAPSAGAASAPRAGAAAAPRAAAASAPRAAAAAAPAAAGRAGTGSHAQTLLTPVRSVRSHRGPALAALAAAVIGVIVAAVASGALGGGGSTPSKTTAARSTATAAKSTHHKAVKHHKAHKPAADQATTSTQATVTASPAAATTTAPTADTLEAQGHQLMDSGNYAAAVPVLRQAVSAASPGSLTYAYALYDLGRSLRLSGDPRAAIPILYQRLQIPNQTEAVRTELQAALQAVGAQVNHGGGAPAPAHGPAGGPPGHGGKPPGHGGKPPGHDRGD
jgi:eukaryotic-like serine/threonine-protein kinase